MDHFSTKTVVPAPSEPRRRKPTGPKVFIKRLGTHHFAYLRAIAQGIDRVQSASRYLGIEHGHEAVTAHAQTMEAVRAIARRNGERGWRLIGLAIQTKERVDIPSLEAFIETRSLDGWSESEVVEMYEAEYPRDKRLERRQASLRKLLDLISRLQSDHVEQPQPTDSVAGWFDDITAKRLITAGHVTLGDLRRMADMGVAWQRSIPGIGRNKARRIISHLDNLLPPSPAIFKTNEQTELVNIRDHKPDDNCTDVLVPGHHVNILESLRNRPVNLIEANSDAEAVIAWVQATTASPNTEKCYLREATRLLVWLREEMLGSTLSDMTVQTCVQYKNFLADIPDQWASRRVAFRGQPGWKPFKGKLQLSSQRQALTIVASMFQWLQAVGYLERSPWVAVNKKLGDDRHQNELDTKAFSESTMAKLLQFIKTSPPSPSRDRIEFIFLFMESVGLRSAELTSAQIKHLRYESEGWIMAVHGKGAKNRNVIIPPSAVEAIKNYLFSRGVGSIQQADPETYILGNLTEPSNPVSYRALYDHVKRWIRAAVSSADLPRNERMILSKATTHWLRHTFGTRAVARNVPADVIQAQMGHASIETTTRIYSRAPLKRRADEISRAFTPSPKVAE